MIRHGSYVLIDTDVSIQARAAVVYADIQDQEGRANVTFIATRRKLAPPMVAQRITSPQGDVPIPRSSSGSHGRQRAISIVVNEHCVHILGGFSSRALLASKKPNLTKTTCGKSFEEKFNLSLPERIGIT